MVRGDSPTWVPMRKKRDASLHACKKGLLCAMMMLSSGSRCNNKQAGVSIPDTCQSPRHTCVCMLQNPRKPSDRAYH